MYKWVFQKFVKLLYISVPKCSFVNGIIKVGSIMIGRKFTLPLRFRRCCIFGKKVFANPIFVQELHLKVRIEKKRARELLLLQTFQWTKCR